MLSRLRQTIAPGALLATFIFCDNVHTAMDSTVHIFDGCDVLSLVHQLKNENVEIRRKAVQDLGGQAGLVGLDERALPALTSCLQDKDSKVRMWSICALRYASANVKPSIPRIIELFSDEDAEVRQASALFFTYRPQYGKQAYVALQKALSDKDLLVRVRSAWAVLLINPRENAGMAVLAKGLKIEDSKIRNEVVRAFGELGIPGLSVLKTAVKEENPIVRLTATQAMAEVALNLGADKKQEFPHDTTESLIELLKHEDKETVYSAVYALGIIGPAAKAAVPRITDLLKDPDRSVRWIAASELRMFGDAAKAAVPALTQLLKDEDEQIRRAAKNTLNSLQR